MARLRFVVVAAALAGTAAGCSGGNPFGPAHGGLGDPCVESAECDAPYICRTDETCGPCTDDAECPAELVCRADGSCASGAIGASCTEDTDCEDGLVCGDTGTCAERGPGDPCTVDSDCRWDLVCRADGTCGAGGMGEPCTSATDCRSDLVCRGDGTCGRPGLGDPCSDELICRSGLVCRPDGTCGAAGTTPEGVPCALTADCTAGLACLWERDPTTGEPRTLCRPAGDGGDSEFCAATADCASGLVCVAEGFGGRCRPASTDGDVDFPCDALTDCAAGLVCSADGTCVLAAAAGGGPGFAIWDGVDCAPRDTTGATRFYFEVPRGPLAPGHDFFRLPWPNDIRRTADGRLDLTDFPHPGTAGPPVDVLDRFLRAAERDLTGFSTNGFIYFRSSNAIDWDTLDGGGTSPTLYFVDLTPATAPTDRHPLIGYGWGASTGGSRYLCQDWLAIRPPRGWPLFPARTYAVVFTTGVLDADGDAMAREPDFEALLQSTRPAGDEPLGLAWDAYAPFRAYLARDGVDPATILVAAVFTTQDVPRTLELAKVVIDARPVSPATGVVRCTATAASPCDDGLTGTGHVRGCFGESAAFDELQGRFATPVFQAGTAPHLAPEDGGGFVYDGAGRPQIQGEADVCFALTIPKGSPMPAGGWPVVVYAHGTGGSFRSFVADGLAERLSAVTLADGSTQRFAVLSFDLPEHGARAGGSTESPDLLFFNVANPAAAYGNVLQGAIDIWQASRVLATTDWDDASSPTGSAVRFDPARLYFYGHSQGATHGVSALAFDGSFAGAVLSGAGGSLLDTLLAKTSPFDVAAALRIALADPDLGGVHPALTVFQTYLEVADPVNYGRFLVRTPLGPPAARSVLMLWGARDTYSPSPAMTALAGSLWLPVAEPVLEDPGGFETAPLPATGNRRSGGDTATAILSQHAAPGGVDGHFVATQVPDARRRIDQFLGTAARDGVPTVVP
jgi:hypothetical protein